MFDTWQKAFPTTVTAVCRRHLFTTNFVRRAHVMTSWMSWTFLFVSSRTGAIQGTPRGLSTMLHVAVQLCQISFRCSANADGMDSWTPKKSLGWLVRPQATPSGVVLRPWRRGCSPFYPPSTHSRKKVQNPSKIGWHRPVVHRILLGGTAWEVIGFR